MVDGHAKIQADALTKRFGKATAVDGVSFNVGRSEVLGLLGPSGCGKTTILRCIAGLEDIDGGRIVIDGRVVSSPSERISVPTEKRRLGFVFQSYALWPHMKIGENIAYCLKGVPRDERERKIEKALELVGLGEYRDRYPSQLSGGQQQRVALARSLSYEPEVLLLDEPLSNLDLKERERVRGELRVLLKRIGITTVFVTHDQEEAFVISDRVLLLNRGRVVQGGTPEELYSNPSDLFVAQFIGRTNVLAAKVEKVSDGGRKAALRLPEIGEERLLCESSTPIPPETSLVAVRFNEVSISRKPIEGKENVLKGTLLSREYRGSVTDHRIQLGGTQITVTTHKFCTASEDPGGTGTMNVYIPPGAIKPLKA